MHIYNIYTTQHRTQYNTEAARTHAITQNRDFYNNSQPLKTINYCFEALCPRCLLRF